MCHVQVVYILHPFNQGSHKVWKTGEMILVREKSGNVFALRLEHVEKSGKSQGIFLAK